MNLVPKIAHFYWGEPEMPYLRYLTLYTFHKQNPDWKLRLYVPRFKSVPHTWTTHEQKYQVSCPDFFASVLKLPVDVIHVDFTGFKISNDIAEVHKSDIFRWHLLATTGGIWSDMDILYFKPMPELHNKTGVCINPKYGHSIGLLFSAGNNQFFAELGKESARHFNPDNYQSVGVCLLNAPYKTIEDIQIKFSDSAPFNIPMDWVYAYNALHIPEIYSTEPVTERFTNDSIGIHWYAGHPLAGEHINKVTPENWHTFNNVLGQALKRSLS